MLKVAGVVIAALAISVLAFGAYQLYWTNPRVIRELREDPRGERARKVMVLTLPSGKSLPVNYLRDGRDGRTVYAAADFPWWRELRDGGGRGSVRIQ